MRIRRSVHRDPLQHGWDFRLVGIFPDSSKVGAHAGVPHLQAVITRDGKDVGRVDVHLHHNRDNFSVGVTIHHRNADRMEQP